MKSLTGKTASVRGWALLLALLVGAGMIISACGEEEVPAPTTPAPTPPAPPPAPEPEPTGPAVPENLRATATTSTSITWSWNAVEGAIGYNVQFGPNSLAFTDTTPAPQSTTNTSYTLQNLAGSTTIHLRVRTVAGTLQEQLIGDWSDPAPGTTAAPPPATALDAPDNVNTSDREDDSIVLSWDEVEDAESYEVEQRSGDEVNYSEASCDGESNVVEDTTCTVTDLDSGTNYDFRVRGLPADDDDAHTAGAWGTVSGTTTGRGPTTTTVTPGGMGDLNIRWHNGGANNANIVFVWDRQGDAMYETVVVAIDGTESTELEIVADVHVENPCKEVNDPDSTETTAKYSTATSATSQDVVTTARGTIRGLCVREEGSSDASFAWGISPAEEPNTGTPDTDENNKTVELTWTDVDLKAAFDYEINLAADPERPTADNKIDRAASAPTSRAVQAACDAGRAIDSFTPDINLNNRTVSVDSGLNPHIGYLLCIRASNGAGTGAWAVSDTADATGTDDATYSANGFAAETYTRPAAPPRAGSPDVDSEDADGSDNERLALTWEIGTRSVSNVPRESAQFNVAVFTQNVDAPDADTMKVADCHVSDPPTGYSFVDPAETDGLSGFEVSVVASANTERVDFTRRVYMCAQANSGSANGHGVGPWTLTSPYSVTKPSTSLSTDSDSVTASEATIEIKGWNRAWVYKTSATNAACTSVSAGTDDANLSGLDASTRYTVRAYADDAACDANKRSLGSTSFTTKASS